MNYLIGKLLCWAGWHRFDISKDKQNLHCVRCPVQIFGWQSLWVAALALRSAAVWRLRALVAIAIALALLLWAGTALGSTQPAQAVEDAALRHGLPSGLLDALHGKECSRRAICPRGLHGEWGPFQIGWDAAFEAGCSGRWRTTLKDSADCAARVLLLKGAKPGRYLRALAGYNGCRAPCRSTWYAIAVYDAFKRAELAAAQAQLLAAR